MLTKLLSMFRNHEYKFVRETKSSGKYYKCSKCNREIYIPKEWSYQFPEREIKKLKGCEFNG